MTEETSPSLEQGTETAASEAPTDFREYAKWRETGELPEQKEDTPAAAPEALAKTEPDSEPGANQEAGDEEEQDDIEATPKSKGGSRQRKIDRLTRENEELRRALAGQPAAPQDRPSQPAAAAGEPKLEDFQTLEAYQKSLTKWTIAEDKRERDEAEAKAAVDKALRTEQETWAAREKAARKAHADWDDVMESATIPGGPGIPDARKAMLQDENGAEMLYYLAKHPKELERIAAMSPHSAVVAIGKLSATFDKPPATENGKPKITGAPKPPPPSGRAAKAISDDPNDPDVQRDFKRWAKAREAQIKGR